VSPQRSIRVELRAVMATEIPGQRFVAGACSKRPEVGGVAADLSGFAASEVSTLPGTSDLTRLLPKWIRAFRNHDGGRRTAAFQGDHVELRMLARMVGLRVGYFRSLDMCTMWRSAICTIELIVLAYDD
jgi:hypothetical protein